jgi:hypothetical protein
MFPSEHWGGVILGYLDYSRGTYALKGRGLSRAATYAWRVGLQGVREN